MIIIGEKLNSSIPKTYEAMAAKDEDYISSVAKQQQEAGADYLDINTAMFQDREFEMMKTVIDIVKDCTSCGIMLDSPSPEIIIKALPLCQGRDVIINSVTIDERIEELVPIALKYDCGIVGLPIDIQGIAHDTENRVKNCLILVEKLRKGKIKDEKIYIDVLVETLATGQQNARVCIETAKAVKDACPNIHIACGLSNISFGLPKRININAAFLSAAVFAGLDSAIMDITNDGMRMALFASLAVSGNDEWCMDYINATRK